MNCERCGQLFEGVTRYCSRFCELHRDNPPRVRNKKERIDSILTRLAAIETNCASCGGTCIAELAALVNDAREVMK